MKQKIKTILMILGILFIGYFTYTNLTKNISSELFEKIVIPTIFASVSFGLIGFNLEVQSKFIKLQGDFILSSILFGVSGLGSLLYLGYSENLIYIKELIGMLNLILFISGIVYVLIILIYSYFMILENGNKSYQPEYH
jgi:hypothetical protein